jgi:hypothetical protein
LSPLKVAIYVLLTTRMNLKMLITSEHILPHDVSAGCGWRGSLQILGAAANVLPRTADKGIGLGPATPHSKNYNAMKCYAVPRN